MVSDIGYALHNYTINLFGEFNFKVHHLIYVFSVETAF
jgi:hypothetical protein